jgi:hypothetical protein
MLARRSAREGYDTLYIAVDPRGPRVRVVPAPLERNPPLRRGLARHFSEPLVIDDVANGLPGVAYFRLFHLAHDGSDFLLYQTAVSELALYDGGEASPERLRALLHETGGFIRNGPQALYRTGRLGLPLWEGGDGTAERRYLEAVELVLRQFNRNSLWLWKRYTPRLLIDYTCYPDEFEHLWYGLARQEQSGTGELLQHAVRGFRAWGHLLFVSDHGMGIVLEEVRVNSLLRSAGLLFVDSNGAIDPVRTSVVHERFSLRLNTTDWKGGVVSPEQHPSVLRQAEQALRELKHPDSGQPLVTIILRRPDATGSRFGIACPECGDLYFDLSPGFTATDVPAGKPVVPVRVPYGTHGFLPERPDMLGIAIGRGSRLPRGRWPVLRAIDIAPLAGDLLHIEPPRDGRGKSPLGHAPVN